MSMLRQGLRRALTTALPRDRFLTRGPHGRREVALTFDDGPHSEETPRLLDLLGQHAIPATFFVVGREAERRPDLIERMVREGHTVGHHSWTHSEPDLTSTATLLAEIERTRQLLTALTGRRPDRFRPPKGKLSTGKLIGLLRGGQRIVLWSSDPRDYSLTDSAALTAWAAAATPTPGEIVLLHDIHPHAARALPTIATWAERCRVRFVGLDAWLPAEQAA